MFYCVYIGNSKVSNTARDVRWGANPRCRQNLKYENFTSSFGRLRQNLASKSVPHVQHDYFSLFNLDHHFMT